MSTTFGVEIKDDDGIGDVVEVAFRSNGMRFINPLAHLLPDETLVIALDNTPQGVVIEKTDPTAEYWRTVKV
jgi:hypothetical protein